MLKFELIASVLAIAWAFAFPNAGARWVDLAHQAFGRIVQRPTLSVAIIGILAVISRVAILSVLPIPKPAIEDEFSYLLMADTFAHGRLANPTPPMWIHFETIHVNMFPTYVSKFFPAQGIFLAIGQVLFGHPFWGVVLSSALMCAALCWMLQAWTSPGWAFFGGIIAVIRLGTFSYWANSYYGGAVAALGGALVLGALPRIKQKQKVFDALLMAIGLALLFNSRPFESLFFSIPVAIALSIWILAKHSPPASLKFKRVVAPLAPVLLLTMLAMAYYFSRTTGNPLQPPYVVNERTYLLNPPFPWQPLRATPVYHHAFLRDFYQSDAAASAYHEYRLHPIYYSMARALASWLFFLNPALSVPLLLVLLALPRGYGWRDLSPETRFLAMVLASTLVGTALVVYFLPHYVAALTCVIYAGLLAAMRRLSSWSPSGRPVGRASIAAVALLAFALIPVRIAASHLGIMLPTHLETWSTGYDPHPPRAAIESNLQQRETSSLALVRYQRTHDPIDEWVYNGADIEHEKIIWARDMGPEKNQELIDYYKGRQVWLVEPDETPPRLQPYPARSEGKIIGAPSVP